VFLRGRLDIAQKFTYDDVRRLLDDRALSGHAGRKAWDCSATPSVERRAAAKRYREVEADARKGWLCNVTQVDPASGSGARGPPDPSGQGAIGHCHCGSRNEVSNVALLEVHPLRSLSSPSPRGTK